MKASISDVARKAGVSVATVSRSFTRADLVSDRTREKVLAIAEGLNFSVSRAPGTMKSGQSLRVALLVGSSEIEWFTAGIVSGLNSVLIEQGYDLVLYPIDSLAKRKDFFENLPLRRNVDAVIVSSFDIMAKEVSRLRSMNIPIVGINISSPAGFSASVSIDDIAGIGLVVRHLHNLGHTNLLYVMQSFGSSLSFSSQRRVTGFIDTCKALDMRYRVLEVEDGSDCVDATMSALLGPGDLPTAVCFHQDSLAIPALFQLGRYGVSVPTDLSVTGFDDSTFADAIELTTVHQDPMALGARTAALTLSMVHGEDVDHTHITVPAELKLRHSTAAPKTADFESSDARLATPGQRGKGPQES